MNGIAPFEFYLGTDIVEVSRIRSSIENIGQKFLDKIYTTSEQTYCNAKATPAIHYAGKFAAKEAVIKAVKSSGFSNPISFHSINITNRSSGEPIIVSEYIFSGSCKVTISHTEKYATATAILII